jgi:hypothetical protein
MRHLLYTYFILFSTLIFSQNENKIVLQGFSLKEKKSIPIGIVSAGVSGKLIQSEKFNLSAGVQFAGAALGKRSGYYMLGYFMEGSFFPNKRIEPGLTLSFLAGGGGSAPDKDGWTLHQTSFLRINLSKQFALQVGASYTYVSGGFIKGWSSNFGVVRQIGKCNLDSINAKGNLKICSISAETGFGFDHKKNRIYLLGTDLSWISGKRFANGFSLHAITNTYGGYMHGYYHGGIQFGFKNIRFTPEVLLGVAGGGAAPVGGGAIYGFQLKSDIFINNIAINLKYQYFKSYNKDFSFNGAYIGIGKNLRKNEENPFALSAFVKNYFGTTNFSNLGLRIPIIEKRFFKISGATCWAFTNNKGAYGEGLFEVILQPSENFPLYSILFAGAGGGAGFNKTKAAFYGFALGLRSPWKKLPFAFEFGRMEGGNLIPYYLNLIYNFRK